jgi:RimJ/RimL family protein N-acetyltransferase
MSYDSQEYPEERAGPFEEPPRTIDDAEGRRIGLLADPADRASLVEMYDEFDPADRAQGLPPVGEERIREWLETILPEGENVVARHDGQVVGHGTLMPDDEGECELAVFVAADYQGAGIGTELVRTLLGHGACQGVDRVWLTVEPWNRAAISVYDSVGFEPQYSGGFDRRYSLRL